MTFRRPLILLSLLVAAASVPAGAANEPPIVTFQAQITDPGGLTRRLETFPLVAVFPDRIADLADLPSAQNLLKTHPALKFTDISPAGDVCGKIPVGLGPVQTLSDVPPPSSNPLEVPTVAAPEFTLVVFSTAGRVIPMVTTPTGIARPLPEANAPSRPDTDPLEGVRRSAADRLNAKPEELMLQSFGTYDFNDDKQPEMVLVASVNGAPAAHPSLLIVATKAALTFPIYTVELEPGSQVMGVGDVNGDGSPEIYVRTPESTRDFGLEIHAWTWRGQSLQRVFQRRSYGCF